MVLEAHIPACFSGAARGTGVCGGFRGLFETGIGAFDDVTGLNGNDDLEWTDILKYVREMNMDGDAQVAMPFDFDFMNLLLRDDLVQRYAEETGHGEPATWEALADFAEYFYDEDLNDDGAPDFGICSLNGAGPGGPQAMLMQIAAAKLQYLGATQGLFFDPESRAGEALIDNAGFREALELTRRLWMASLDSEPGGWTYLHEDAWLGGRCAAYLWLTGSVALVQSTPASGNPRVRIIAARVLEIRTQTSLASTRTKSY